MTPSELRKLADRVDDRYGDEHVREMQCTLRQAADEIERLQVETEGRWQDMLNTQDRMVIAEERLEQAEARVEELMRKLELAEAVCDHVDILLNMETSTEAMLPTDVLLRASMTRDALKAWRQASEDKA